MSKKTEVLKLRVSSAAHNDLVHIASKRGETVEVAARHAIVDGLTDVKSSGLSGVDEMHDNHAERIEVELATWTADDLKELSRTSGLSVGGIVSHFIRNVAKERVRTKPVRTWRETRRNGRASLLSPDGEEFYGTPREVNTERLAPFVRDGLADRLRVVRDVYTRCDKVREIAARNRREAIRIGAAMELRGYIHYPGLSIDREIMAGAAARVLGLTVEEFIGEAINSAIESAAEIAPGGKIELTRHERAAIERAKGVMK